MTEGVPHEYKEAPGACADCGNSPVNHLEQYVANTLAVWSAEALSRGRGVHFLLTRVGGRVFDSLEQIFLRAVSAMPFASFSRDVKKAATYRSQVVWEEAVRRGIEMQQVVLFGRGTEIYRASLHGRWFYFQSLPIPIAMRGESAAWLDDKYALKQSLATLGVSAPQSFSAATLAAAVQAFRSLGAPVVVKPRSGSRGRHTTVRVTTEEDLVRAFRSARKLCRYVSIERSLVGPVCRATLVGGKLVGFFRADAPFVVGDGTSSIRQLIDRKNAMRQERVQDVVLTAEHRQFLARQGFEETSVPGDGVRVQLTHRTGRLYGGTTREMLGSEHPRLRERLERAALELGIGIVGFDLIVPVPENDPDSQEWGIIEANTLPYIDLHYLALEGAPSHVAADVWDMWDVAMHREEVDAQRESATIGA